jgi:type VI secretion system secreted protein VgrG
MPTYTQDTRLLSVDTPLGKDVLLMSGFSGTEAISRLFTFQLELYSTKGDIAPKDIIGKSVTWAVSFHHSKPRYFNGIVSRFSSGGKSLQGIYHYSADVVPALWLLTRTSNCRMFQNKTASDIIQAVIKEYGVTEVKPDLKATYKPREYCVQYRETAFNFVSRLMEEEGIFYYFTHDNGKHTLVLADNKNTHKDVPESKAHVTGGGTGTNTISSWLHTREFRPGKWTVTDYNFETPSTSLLASSPTVVKLPGNEKYEKFDFPGEYTKKAEGDAESKVRMEEDETPYDIVQGTSTCVTFTAGGKFTADRHDVEAEQGKGYILTSVAHNSADADSYANHFTAIPDTVPFRPERSSARPVVPGTQPAVVVGPKGQEIYTDKYGRVKVHFFWDRESKKDENSSCWIRVAQIMAGKRWGASFWPRIGQEVLVAFLEGDPDRPIIVGVVYNAEQMPPYQGDGPDDKHKSDNKVSGYKSNTTMGGVGFNEWRFDDTKDKQQVFIHAEKDMDERVKNDSRELVLANRHLIVGSEKTKGDQGDQREEIWRHKELHVHHHQTEWIEGTYALTIGKGQASDGVGFEVLVEKDRWQTIEGQDNLHVKQDAYEQVDGGKSLTVGGGFHTKASKDICVEATQNVHIKGGQTVIIEAGTQLSLKVGGNFIDISSSGINIVGTLVGINSGGAAGSGPGSNPVAPADAEKTEPTKPDVADDAKSGQKSAP